MANNPYVNKVVYGNNTLIDLTDATATADKILQGYTAYGADGQKLTGTATGGGDITVESLSVTQNGTYTAPTGKAYSPVSVNVSGGGGSSAGKKQINFIDYDGTIVESYTATEWQSVTALPSNPSHTGLTAQGWNWTKAQINAQLTAMPNGEVWVGQMYVTDDGKTRIYIHLEEGRLHPYLGICPNGTVVVDWGDNSATATLTGTSLTTVKYADHEYANSGDYVITFTVSSGSFAFFGVANTSHILTKDTTTTGQIHKVYSNAVQKIELGTGANIGSYAFNYCYSLSSITIPSSVTSIGTNAFRYCYSLASVVIPSGVTSIGNGGEFYYCYSLVSVSIPGSVTGIGNSTFYYCYSLSSITIPSGITSIGSSMFRYCHSLASVVIPSGVTSIGTNAFDSCFSLSSITIPSGVTSIGTNMFSSCCSLSSITIPSGVTSIAGGAFSSCYGMAEYHLLSTTPPTLSRTTAFSNIQSDCVIYVPSASLTTYKTASNWSTYASYMKGE